MLLLVLFFSGLYRILLNLAQCWNNPFSFASMKCILERCEKWQWGIPGRKLLQWCWEELAPLWVTRQHTAVHRFTLLGGILSVSQVPSVFSSKKENVFFVVWKKKCFLYGVAFDGLIGQRLQENNPLKPPFWGPCLPLSDSSGCDLAMVIWVILHLSPVWSFAETKVMKSKPL